MMRESQWSDSPASSSRRIALARLALTCPLGVVGRGLSLAGMNGGAQDAERARLDRDGASLRPAGGTMGSLRFSSDELRKLVPSLSAASHERLLRTLNDRSLRAQIPTAEVESIVAVEQSTVEDLMVSLLPVAQIYSHSPLSHYKVGAVLRGSSGSLYLGTNIEVPHQTLGFAVHGEQCAVTNAFMHGESGVTSLAVTAAPCGHCRQFLNELRNAADLKVLVKGSRPATLPQLLPESFGPGNLGITERLFNGKKAHLELTTSALDETSAAALEAASRSYSPYTKSPSGIAILTSTKAVYQGSYIENAAYNPSLSPLQAALVGLVMAGGRFTEISIVVLVEMEKAAISQMSATRAVLDAISPSASLRRILARPNQ